MAELVTWQSALERHPHGADSTDPGFWETFLGEHPDVLHRLLHDVYQMVYGVEKPPTLDDLWEIMAQPAFSTLDYGPAVLDVLETRGMSIRWLAQQMSVNHSYLWKHLQGQRPIVNVHDIEGSMSRLEATAAALRLHPSYFVEWRRLWIMRLIDAAFKTQPALSINVFRRYSGFEQSGNVRSKGNS